MTIRSVRTDNEHLPCVIILNSSGGGIVGTIDSHYYLGQGARGGVEREFIVIYEADRNDSEPHNTEMDNE